MLSTYRKSYKNMVYSINSQDQKVPVGIFIDFLIDPDNGIMKALWIQTLDGKKCLDPQDLLHWRQNEILIKDSTDLYPPEINQKLLKIFNKECAILGAKVLSWPKKERIGRVTDFGFDTISPRLLSLHVRANFWQPWKKSIIPYARIHKISEAGIYVKHINKLKTPLTDLSKIKTTVKNTEEMPKVDSSE